MNPGNMCWMCGTVGFVLFGLLSSTSGEFIHQCDTNLCQNGGTCISNSTDTRQYFCQCQTGFTGMECENEVIPEVTSSDYTDDSNECISNPCSNCGTCVDGVNSYTCKCTTGFTGTNCETDVDECNSTDRCHGFACTNIFGGFCCS